MKVAILGFSVIEQSENLPLYRYFKSRGDDITAFYWGGKDVAEQMPTDIQKIAIPDKDVTFDELDDFDLVVRSPIIHPSQIKTKTPVTTLYNIFMEHCEAPTIGITGTKGKGTTSTLIAKILEAAGKTVYLGGNIGTPLLDYLSKITPKDYVVLELSNFQLIDANYGTDIAVCLMMVPEHMDWHATTEEYFNAKARLFSHQTADGITVYNYENSVSVSCANQSPATKIPFDVPADSDALPTTSEGAYVSGNFIYMRGTKICAIQDIALLGRHNLENVCAAIAATWDIIDGDVALITSVITTFKGLEHRLEFVREFSGVQYYNDSFATTPETSIAALKAFSQPKVMIVGGHDKGIPFDVLAKEIAQHTVKHVIAIGDTGETIARLIQAHPESVGTTFAILGTTTTMPEIVQNAREHASTGDVVLLSTGCASFGLFTDYKERGKQFKAAVAALA